MYLDKVLSSQLTIMQIFVLLVFVFSMGAIIGWVIEVFYRHFADKEKKWVNPGFCVGPWLPVYGFGLVIIYTISFMEILLMGIENEILRHIILFVFMSIGMTIMELIAGLFLEKYYKIKLWDYTNEWLNYKGYICPKFTFYWMILAAIYYFVIHPIVFDAVCWLASKFEFSFFVGMVFSVFIIDVIYSGSIVSSMKKFLSDNSIVVMLEEAKETIRKQRQATDEKARFFLFMIKENLQNYMDRIKTLEKGL